MPLINSDGFGIGQSLVSVALASRVSATTYYNLSSKPKMLILAGAFAASGGYATLTVNGVLVGEIRGSSTGGYTSHSISAVVPPNGSYACTYAGLVTWVELG